MRTAEPAARKRLECVINVHLQHRINPGSLFYETKGQLRAGPPLSCGHLELSQAAVRMCCTLQGPRQLVNPLYAGCNHPARVFPISSPTENKPTNYIYTGILRDTWPFCRAQYGGGWEDVRIVAEIGLPPWNAKTALDSLCRIAGSH